MNWLKNLYGVPILVIVWFMDTYKANRAWLAGRMIRPRLRALFQAAVIATFLAWIGIWAFAGDEYRGRLSETVKTLWAETFSSPGKAQ